MELGEYNFIETYRRRAPIKVQHYSSCTINLTALLKKKKKNLWLTPKIKLDELTTEFQIMLYIFSQGEKKMTAKYIGQGKKKCKILTTMYYEVSKSLVPPCYQIKFPHCYIYLDLYSIVKITSKFSQFRCLRCPAAWISPSTCSSHLAQLLFLNCSHLFSSCDQACLLKYMTWSSILKSNQAFINIAWHLAIAPMKLFHGKKNYDIMYEANSHLFKDWQNFQFPNVKCV